MTVSKTACLGGCLLLILTGSAVADSAFSKLRPMSPIGASKNEPPRNYLGASLGSATTDEFCDGLADCGNDGKSWKAFAGVRMNENIVLESGYVDFGKQTGLDTSGEISQQATAFTVAGVAGIPLSEQIELFGKAGMARWSVEQTINTNQTETTGSDVLVGVGGNYNLGDNMGIRAEWERFKDVGSKDGKAGDIDLLSLGFTFSSL
ncbi:MAG: outer membrane beta-barrel protein [Thiothrix sp.]